MSHLFKGLLKYGFGFFEISTHEIATPSFIALETAIENTSIISIHLES